MTREELFKAKGELSWLIEVSQARLNAINQELLKIENSQQQAVVPKQTKKEAKTNGNSAQP